MRKSCRNYFYEAKIWDVFPWLFTVCDFLASLVSILIANSILQRTEVFEGAQFSAFLPLSVFWLLISALRKDYKIGRAQMKGYRGEIESSFQIRSGVRRDYFYINN